MAQDVIPSIAERYSVSEGAARQIEQSLRASRGQKASFDHPDLGGPGDWTPGRAHVSRPGDRQLCARVEGLCAELAAIIRGDDTSAPESLMREPDTAPAGACVALEAGESWWPAFFGHPATSGETHGVRYAYFRDSHRLLIQAGGRVLVYDTAEHDIAGVSPHQVPTSRLTLLDQSGEIPIEQLRALPHEEAVPAAHRA